MKKALLLLATLAPAAALAQQHSSSVVGSKHDLSTSGPGPIKALSEGNPCVFCHIPHAGTVEFLSSRPDTQAKHTPYQSSTVVSRVGAPTGASRVCLSCHDGTIAVGRTRRAGPPIAMTVGTIPADRKSNLGTDLRKTHPVSFRPESGSKTRKPSKRDAAHLDAADQVQCTSCHDPHDEYRDPGGKFLVKANRRSALCLTCHETGVVEGPGASHANSSATFGPAEGNEGGFASVADAGCAACHASHNTDAGGRLVKKAASDDDGVCLRCHAGKVARRHIGNEISKPYGHGGQGRGVHDASEGTAKRPMPENAPGTPRHVVCVDCHNPHMATGQKAIGPTQAVGPLAGVWGVDLNGVRVEQVQFEYEVCLKCHGDSVNKPQSNGAKGIDSVRRQIDGANLRLVFAPSSPSFHPLAAPGLNQDVPSLKAPLTPASVIRCSDCHASDAGPGNGGAGPRGPHGSIYPKLLERGYSTLDFTAESPTAYALCYKCHDRDVLLSDAKDAFRKIAAGGTRSLHALHVRDRQSPCSACHDAHGVSRQGGTPTANAHLVNFDVAIVKPGQGGPPSYRGGGSRTGSCNLSCHGTTHSDTTHAY